MGEMLGCAMTYETKRADSDSASLGSNPSPPASLSATKSMPSRDGQNGQSGTGREFWPHTNRHRDAAFELMVAAEGWQMDRLFQSRDHGWGSRSYYEDRLTLLSLRLRGEISIRAHAIPPAVLSGADRARAHRACNQRESVWHCWLKQIGIAWLFDTWRIRAVEEYRCYGFRYDVAAPKHRILLECGNTNIASAIEAMRGPEPWRYFLLPFSQAADRWLDDDGARRVFLFELAITEKGSAFLDREDEERLLAPAPEF